MTDFLKTIKNNPSTPRDIELNVDTFSNKPYEKQLQVGQNASKQRRVYEETKQKLGNIFEDTDEKNEPEDNEVNFPAGKKRNSKETSIKTNGRTKFT